MRNLRILVHGVNQVVLGTVGGTTEILSVGAQLVSAGCNLVTASCEKLSHESERALKEPNLEPVSWLDFYRQSNDDMAVVAQVCDGRHNKAIKEFTTEAKAVVKDEVQKTYARFFKKPDVQPVAKAEADYIIIDGDE